MFHNEEELYVNRLNNANGIWIAPGNKKNLKLSIDNPMRIDNGELQYAWAFNKRFNKRFNKLREGDVVIFGDSTQKNVRVCFVTHKLQDISILEQWPYKSDKWGYGFYLTKPKIFNIHYKKIVEATGKRVFPTQLPVDEEHTQNIRNLIRI